jgi:branched-chain amino acid transport system substrate-binding protein
MIGRGDFLASLGATTVAQAIPLPNYATQIGIGVVAPFSGPARAAGEALGNGVRAAIDEYNRTRFTNAPIFSIRTFDDRNDVQSAAVNAQFVTADPTIVAVIGHLGAKGTLAALRTYAEALMPLIVPAVTDDELTAQGYRTVFRLPTRDYDEGRLIAEYVVRSGKPSKPIVISKAVDYGPGVVEGYVAAMHAAKITATSIVVPADKPDLDAIAASAAASTPDHVVLAGYVSDLGPLLRALRAHGYTGPIAACQGFFDATTLTTYGKDAEGLIISTSMPYLPLAPNVTQLVQDYQQTYGALIPVAAFAYAATQIVIAAVQRSGATQHATLARTMAQLGGTYSTLVGNFQFSVTGDTFDPELYFYRVAGGKLDYVRQAHPSSFLSR